MNDDFMPEMRVSWWGVTKLAGIGVTLAGCAGAWLLNLIMINRADGGLLPLNVGVALIMTWAIWYYGRIFIYSMIVARNAWRFKRWLKHAPDCPNCKPQLDAMRMAWKIQKALAEAEKQEASEE
jgi:hypothetical protein